MEAIPPLSEIIAALRRHIVAFAAIVMLGMLASVIYALNQTRLYQTSAVIQIQQPEISDRVGGGGSASIIQQLQIVEQRLMSRDNLLRIIDKFALYADEPGLDQDEKVLRLRLASKVEQIVDPAMRWRPDFAPTALTITVSDADPLQAARVANEFVDNLLDENRNRRTEQAREALSFFETEEARVEAEIDALEARLATFKQKNADLLPEGIASLRSQQVNLSETGLEIERQILEIEGSVTGQANSVFSRRLARLQEQKALIDRRLAEIDAQISQAPEVERSFSTLTRELSQKSDQLAIINRNRAEAEMAQALQLSQQAETFEVLETALIPQHPYAPNRRKIAATGSAISLALAISYVILMELLNPVIRTARQLERRLGLRPVVTIPVINAPPPPLSHRLVQLGILILAIMVIFLIL